MKHIGTLAIIVLLAVIAMNLITLSRYATRTPPGWHDLPPCGVGVVRDCDDSGRVTTEWREPPWFPPASPN